MNSIVSNYQETIFFLHNHIESLSCNLQCGHRKTSSINEQLAANWLNQSKRNFSYCYLNVCPRDWDYLKLQISHVYSHSENVLKFSNGNTHVSCLN